MRLGKLFFQSNGKEDVFLSVDVRPDGIVPTYESSNLIEPLQFDGDKAWINGEVPRIYPVNISADTAMLHCWFNGETFSNPFTIRIYIECELVEEIVDQQEAEYVAEQLKKAGKCDYNDRCLLNFKELDAEKPESNILIVDDRRIYPTPDSEKN
jgi:hypothetical protein